MKKYSLAFIVILFALKTSYAQWSVKVGDKRITPNDAYLYQQFTDKEWKASNFATPAQMKWFADARFGMFIHFGLSTYVGKELSWGTIWHRKFPDQTHPELKNKLYPDSVWTKWPEKLTFEKFDATKVVQIAKAAGMKYIVVIAKHHEGFHLWDTKLSDFKITNTPFGRDMLKEIADACHKAHMRFGIYYSQRDWHHPDYAPADTALPKINGHWQQGKSHKKYIDYQFKAVKELCTQYGKVDIFWFDAVWWGGMFTADMWESEKLTRMIRKLQPGIIINNRASIPGDFDTPEQRVGMFQNNRAWESCSTVSQSWSWTPSKVNPPKKIIKLLESTAVGDGNLLLSWGPKWDGSWDVKQTNTLESTGAWLQHYGESIYGTRGGPWLPENWGGTTYKGNIIYVHLINPVQDTIAFNAIKGLNILSATSLTGQPIKWIENRGSYKLIIDKNLLKDTSVVVELKASRAVLRSDINQPVYGSLFNDEANYGKKVFEKNSLLIGDQYIANLGKQYLVKGLSIKTDNKESAVFEVYTSVDGKEWEKYNGGSMKSGVMELPITSYQAGAYIPGKELRFVKIVPLKSALTNTSYTVVLYGTTRP